ncbi:MAG: PAS domain S-box protein, partial [Candidatus Omnitrophota bacterium]
MSGKRIFIIEDERIVALDLQNRLARLGHEVVGNFSSADKALVEIESSKPDIVLTDIKMEGNIDGIEFANAVHNRYGIPVIFVTAYSDSKTLARVKASNACGFILKPFTDEELQATIDIGLHEHDLEIKLKQSEEQYRSLFDDAPIGYHEIDLEGKLTRVNRTELEMLGYSASDMIGRPVWDFAEEHNVAREAVMEKLSAGKISSQPFERNYLRRNGRFIPVLIKDFPIRSDNGALLGIRSTIMDISVLKEEQTRAASFFAITEKSVSGIIIADSKGLVRYLNPAAEELLGMRRTIHDQSALKDADNKEAVSAIIEENPNGIIKTGQKEYSRRVMPVIRRILRRRGEEFLGDKLGGP